MKVVMDERLEAVIRALDEQISLLRSSGLNDSARLLEMARLDLQMRMHAISDEELHALCAALHAEHGDSLEGAAAARESAPQKHTTRASSARVVVPITSLVRRKGNVRKQVR
jgi:hypothetical protein